MQLIGEKEIHEMREELIGRKKLLIKEKKILKRRNVKNVRI